MCKGTYTKKITDCLQELGIPSKKKEHFGRNTGPAIMDVEEVCGLDQRNMGNWAADVFQKNYSKRLPLGALRVLAGFSKERGYYKNTRTTFTGGHKYIELWHRIFPWVDDVLNDNGITKFDTAKSFLELLRNLRWVILQDAALLTTVYGRKHCMFSNSPEIFESDLFKDYANDLQRHMNASIDPNDVNIETVLPGVLGKFEQQHNCLKKMKEDISTIKSCVDSGHVVKEVTQNVDEKLKSFSGFIGNAFTLYASQDDTTNNSLSLSQHRDISVATPQLEGDRGSIVQDKTTTVQIDNDTTALCNIQENEITVDNDTYSIPDTFETVKEMLEHWEKCVIPRLDKHKSEWRKHLSTKEKKKYSRLKMIVEKIENLIENGTCKDEVIAMFENYYSSHKKGFSKLADEFVKEV